MEIVGSLKVERDVEAKVVKSCSDRNIQAVLSV